MNITVNNYCNNYTVLGLSELFTQIFTMISEDSYMKQIPQIYHFPPKSPQNGNNFITNWQLRPKTQTWLLFVSYFFLYLLPFWLMKIYSIDEKWRSAFSSFGACCAFFGTVRTEWVYYLHWLPLSGRASMNNWTFILGFHLNNVIL